MRRLALIAVVVAAIAALPPLLSHSHLAVFIAARSGRDGHRRAVAADGVRRTGLAGAGVVLRDRRRTPPA